MNRSEARIGLAGLFITICAATQALEPPPIPVGTDAYLRWDLMHQQRIGARAYMRSTYDRAGRNETADASHFLYQENDEFNVTLDVEGLPGVLYFVRTNHWHGSPWHFEVDGADHLVQETTTADPTRKLEHSVFIPEELFPNPLTWTYSITKGADLMWVPIPFESTFRLAYSRTFYGTGYYIYHHYLPDANLSQPIASWDGKTPPPRDVLDLISRSGQDLVPHLEAYRQTVPLGDSNLLLWQHTSQEHQAIRAMKISVPASDAEAIGQATLKVTWDNRESPSIETPLSLFFGAGVLYNRDGEEYLVKGFPISVRFADERVHLACYYPMPFRQDARLELTNCDPSWKGAIEVEVKHEKLTIPFQYSSYFHATYRDHPKPELGEDVELLDTKVEEGGGDWTGAFVGTSFIFSHNANLRTLEGDPRFYFDDSRSPQAYGTGTEEWGGGGDYWGGSNMTLPFAGHPCGARNAHVAKNEVDLIQSAYRFLIADLMPFGKNARITLEHGGENNSQEHYETVTYWYGLPGASLVKTDELDIGDLKNEAAHHYHATQTSPPIEISSRYELGVDSYPVHTKRGDLANPEHFIEWEFKADPKKKYQIWLRGHSLSTTGRMDSVWLQFDNEIGTDAQGRTYAHPLGGGNWSFARTDGVYSWSSSIPRRRPRSITFEEGATHRLRVQPRGSDYYIDQIWLSATQTKQPEHTDFTAKPLQSAAGKIDEIVLDASNFDKRQGNIHSVVDPQASVDRTLAFLGKNDSLAVVYPPHKETGRWTRGTSEFTLKIDPHNHGILLRRTLDYSYPDQRAKVFVADADAQTPEWQSAGTWYLAGSNTCYHSYPQQAGELGKPNPIVQTSNRRFRDDEFLIAKGLTRDKSSLRIRIQHDPVGRPLLPEMEVPNSAWSELGYSVYCWVDPPE